MATTKDLIPTSQRINSFQGSCHHFRASRPLRIHSESRCLVQFCYSVLALWCLFFISPCCSESITTVAPISSTNLQSTTEVLTTPLPSQMDISPTHTTLTSVSPTSVFTGSETLNSQQSNSLVSLVPSSIELQITSFSPTIQTATPSQTSTLVQATSVSSSLVNTLSSVFQVKSSTPSITVRLTQSINRSQPQSSQLVAPTSSQTIAPSISPIFSMPPDSNSISSITPVLSPSTSLSGISLHETPRPIPTDSGSSSSVTPSIPTETQGPGNRETGDQGMRTGLIVGIICALTLAMTLVLAVIIFSCYLCFRSRKYEYNTGNEYRVTVQHWKNSDHYTANRSETVSLSSSRGSSFMSSIGLKPKIRSRYGSSPADRVTTVVNPEFFYSTPL